MKKMIWTNELSIGNTKIDNEHKKLLDVIDDLVELVELNSNRQKFAEILSKMTDYVFSHLRKEENYMKDFGYPKLNEHIQNHNEYNYKVAMYNIELLGNNPPDPNEIIEYLEKWWKNHILIFDMDYEKFKNNIEPDAKYRTI